MDVPRQTTPNDDAYFENMTRVIFLAGLSWKTIDKKWPDFRKAFKNFSIDEAAKFDENDLKRLGSDAGIVRNRAKIIATINNAKQFQNIREECGSFQSYIDGLDKSNNFALIIKELGKKFNRIGPNPLLEPKEDKTAQKIRIKVLSTKA